MVSTLSEFIFKIFSTRNKGVKMPKKRNKKHKYKLINQETEKVISYFKMKLTAVQEQKRIEREYFGLKTQIKEIENANK